MPIDMSKLPHRQRAAIESLDLQTRQAVELLAEVQAAGFIFHRLAADGALFGRRETALWKDTIRLDGVSSGCSAQRHIKDTGLILEPIVTITGSAVEVTTAVLHWTRG